MMVHGHMYYFVPFFWQTIFYCMVWNIGTNSIFDELWYRKLNWISSLQVFSARHLLGRYSVGTTYVQPKCMIVQSGDIAFSDFRFFVLLFWFSFCIGQSQWCWYDATLLMIQGTMYSTIFFTAKTMYICSVASRRYYSGLLLL